MNSRSRLAGLVLLAILGLLSFLAAWPGRSESAVQGGQSTSGPRREEALTVLEEGVTRREQAASLSEHLVDGWTVRCRDSRGRGVAADIFVRTDEALRRLGSTGASGVGEFERPRAPCEIVARGPARTSTSRLLLAQPEGPLELVLPDAQVLDGLVELSGGGPAPAGITVMAFPRNRSLAFERRPIYEAREDPEVHIAKTDGAGRFRLEGLAADQPYRLLAGGQGFLRRGLNPVTAQVGEFVQLEVARVFVAWARFVESDHAPAHIGQGVPPGGSLKADLEKSQGLLQPHSLEAQLALSMPELADLPANEFLFLAVSSSALDEIGPLKTEATFPGYSGHRGTLQMSALEHLAGPQELVLSSRTDQRGELEVVISGPSEPSFGRRAGPTLNLVLHSEDDELQYSVPDPVVGTHHFADIPAGRYRVILQDESKSWRLPAGDEPQIVEISSTKQALAFSLDGLVDVEIDLVLSSGEVYQGEARLLLGVGYRSRELAGSMRAVPLLFERAPYCVPYLAPGSYQLVLQVPVKSDPQSFELVAGPQQRITVQMAP